MSSSSTPMASQPSSRSTTTTTILPTPRSLHDREGPRTTVTDSPDTHYAVPTVLVYDPASVTSRGPPQGHIVPGLRGPALPCASVPSLSVTCASTPHALERTGPWTCPRYCATALSRSRPSVVQQDSTAERCCQMTVPQGGPAFCASGSRRRYTRCAAAPLARRGRLHGSVATSA